ncbi:MAG: hypothetical protein IRZ08_19900, partial [Frankia sp.]|nr:hypothetical protein [Frankia sp.]
MTALSGEGMVARTPTRASRRPGWLAPLGRRPAWVWLVRGLLLALAVGAAVGLAAGRPDGVPRRAVALDDGVAWLVSAEVGQAALVDGASAQVLARVDIGAADPVAVQAGADAFVSTADGTVLRVDGATHRVSGPPAPFSRARERVELYPGPDVLFAVNPDRGLVLVVDPRTLEVRRVLPVDAQIRDNGVLADDANQLWLIDGATGDLLVIDQDGRLTRRPAVDPDLTWLVSVAGRPVAVDLASGRARPLRADGVRAAGACLGGAAGDQTVVVGGAGAAPPPGQLRADAGEWVLLASQRRGLLFLADLATGGCADVVDLDTAGHELGQPVETAGLVFVPDFTASQVIVVDLARREVSATANVPVPNGTRFDLRPAGSVMFFNDPAGRAAGIIRTDGSITTIEKYDDAQGHNDGGGSGQAPPPDPVTPSPPPSTPPAPPTTPPPTPTPSALPTTQPPPPPPSQAAPPPAVTP